jgi:aquaporin Z
MKKLVMEFLGTFFLVLTVAITGNPLAIAAMLMAWIYIGAYVSGAHYNPAVSLAVGLRGSWLWESIARFWAAQVLGGFVAYGATWFLASQIVVPTPSIPVLPAFLVEVLLTFVFALVVLTLATTQKYAGNYVFGFGIGFTVLALAILGSPFTGGLFNPAISIGANLFALLRGAAISWEHLFMYVGGALLGGVLAAYAYRYFGLEDKR